MDSTRLEEVLQRTIEASCAVSGAASGDLDVLIAPGEGRFSVGGPPSGGSGAPGAEVLQVPVMVDEAIFAWIRLGARSGEPPFTDEDRGRVVAVATVAGATIARLTRQHEHRWRRWVALQNEVASALLAGSQPPDLLRLAARGARELAGADLAVACVAQPGAGPKIEVRAAQGHGADAVAGSVFDVTGTLLEQVMTSGELLELDSGGGVGHPEMLVAAGVDGPALILPLSVDGETIGTLVVGRLAGRPPFSEADRSLVESFALQVTLALEYGLAHVELRRVAVAADQERIARDLHDTVIQQLYAIGMSLQSLAKSVADDRASARLHQSVDALDVTISDIRSTVFALENPPGENDGLRSKIVFSASELCRTYGLAAPRVRFDGLVDTMVPEPVARHILATLREAVSNVGRHAQATRVDIDVTVDSAVLLRVADNGLGIPEHIDRRSGLRNLQERAGSLGGTMSLTRLPNGGTVLLWRVPLVDGADRRPAAEVTGEHIARVALANGAVTGL
ncbi:MAG: histidine kinase [Acidimicrobiales bacterium]